MAFSRKTLKLALKLGNLYIYLSFPFLPFGLKKCWYCLKKFLYRHEWNGLRVCAVIGGKSWFKVVSSNNKIVIGDRKIRENLGEKQNVHYTFVYNRKKFEIKVHVTFNRYNVGAMDWTKSWSGSIISSFNTISAELGAEKSFMLLRIMMATIILIKRKFEHESLLKKFEWIAD